MPPKDSDLTPMYRQWAQAKRDFPDVLLLFRMGDFYEMFGEDAEVGARALGLTLTARKYSGDRRMPMCGVPHHALDRYLRMLVEQGFRAAICEQTEDPRQAKGLVKRQVTRVVTPGTLTEDELLPANEHNFLVSVKSHGQKAGIAAVDVSTGVFMVTEVPITSARAAATPSSSVRAASSREAVPSDPPLPIDPSTDNPFAPALDEIRRLGPAEIIVDAADPLREAIAPLDVPVTALPDDEPQFLAPAEQLQKHFGVDTLLGFGLDGQQAAIAAAAQALRYLQATHLQALPQLTGLSYYSTQQFMLVDATTRRNLELTESLRGGKQATLVHLLDKTNTSMGARLLKDWVVQPLLDARQIERRLEAVENLVNDGVLAEALREHLKSIFDLERLTSRTTAGTANARDLRSLAVSLQRLPELQQELETAQAELLRELRGEIGGDVGTPSASGGHPTPDEDSATASPSSHGVSGGTPDRVPVPDVANYAGTPSACGGHPTPDEDSATVSPSSHGVSGGTPDEVPVPDVADHAGTPSACGGHPTPDEDNATASPPSHGVSGGTPDEVPVPHAANLAALSDLLARAISDEPPVTITEGGLIREGFSADLDELRNAAAHGREWIAALQDQERARTGIKNLKIGFNQVFGYYIEVTKSFLQFVPEDYNRKQTLANAERFITPELKEWENKVLGADERSRDLEYELFVQVRAEAARHVEQLVRTARALAQVDVLCALAQAAVQYGYSRPEIVEGDELEIVAGRHPVVEQTAEAFVPNDARLDCRASQLLIITGPNMAGKSTYLRQVALITLMAQMGSFVPAKSARIGLVDRIFTRVGASDDLATGQSTFMVEMTETANILHNATGRSLVILDEIGRGTSTFDGLSIAWAVAEYLIRQVGAKTLFATHYHHLNELVEILPRVRNLRVLVREEGDHITFLRKIAEGGTDRSYGIQVARLAGLPQEVIERAKEVLRTIEQEDLAVAPSQQAAKHVAPPVQLHLFEAAPHPVVEKLKGLDVDTLTPVEALLLLKELQDGL